jgi:hypothetical protein
MSTKSSIYYAVDDSGISCHIYWELAERVLQQGRMVAAPVMISFGDAKTGDPLPIRLTPEIARQIFAALGKMPDTEIT